MTTERHGGSRSVATARLYQPRPRRSVALQTTALVLVLVTTSAFGQTVGWRPLFDGKTTAGWRGYKMDKMPPGWKVIDGALVRVSGGEGGKGAGGGDDIITVEQFDNFELELEWKIVDRAGNSG